MLALSNVSVPLTLLRYPRSVSDSRYLYDKLKPVLENIAYQDFDDVFRMVARPELVNSFNANDRVLVS